MIQRVTFEIECDYCDALLELRHVAESPSFIDADGEECVAGMWHFLKAAASKEGWGCDAGDGSFACPEHRRNNEEKS